MGEIGTLFTAAWNVNRHILGNIWQQSPNQRYAFTMTEQFHSWKPTLNSLSLQEKSKNCLWICLYPSLGEGYQNQGQDTCNTNCFSLYKCPASNSRSSVTTSTLAEYIRVVKILARKANSLILPLSAGKWMYLSINYNISQNFALLKFQYLEKIKYSHRKMTVSISRD